MMEIISDDIDRILYLLAEHKNSVSSLYTKYSKIFPDEVYWVELAEVKSRHRELIQSVYFSFKNETSGFDNSVFHSAAIKTSLEWVTRLITESEKHDILKALAYTLDLEQSRIEQKYFDIFKTESLQINKLLPTIMAENDKYLALIQQKLAQARQNSPLI